MNVQPTVPLLTVTDINKSRAFYGMSQLFVTDPDGYSLCFENPL